MSPREKEEPGSAVLRTRVAVPDMSVAVGSIQFATAPLLPSSTVVSMFVGQLAIVGR